MIIIENRVSEDGMHHVHLISNDQSDLEIYQAHYLGRGAQMEREEGAWHLRIEYRYQGALDVELGGKPKIRRFVVWPVDQSVETAIGEAAGEFEQLFGCPPMFAWMRKLPGELENGARVGDASKREINLFEAVWALRGSVMVGGDALLDE